MDVSFVSSSDQKMIFITGASRSGTTLMSFILRNHSRIFGLKELHYFGDFYDPRIPQQKFTSDQLITAAASIFARQEQGILNAKPGQQHFERASALYDTLRSDDRNPSGLFAAAVGELAGKAGKDIPCEQTPRNVFYAEALMRLYPNAHVVYMMRDPRAVMASQKKRWQRRRLAADKNGIPLYQSLRVWINYHPYTVANLWHRAYCEAHRLSFHPRFTLIRFEDLLAAPEDTLRHLCAWLGVEFEPGMLDVGQVNSSHQSSAGGARKGIYKDAIDAWNTTLSTGEVAVTERICGRGMAAYGYTFKANSSPKFGTELLYKLSYLLHVAGVISINPQRAWVQLRAAFRNPRA